jgi:hypothetical protein
LKFAYNIFPHFIRTIIHDDIKIALDKEFLIEIKKLPCKNSSLISKAVKYSDFFNKFLKEIEKNI